MTEFKIPANPDRYHHNEDDTDTPEPAGDRIGNFTPEIGAHSDAADALPSHEDLLARQSKPELTEAEKAKGLEEVERAKKTLGYN